MMVHRRHGGRHLRKTEREKESSERGADALSAGGSLSVPGSTPIHTARSMVGPLSSALPQSCCLLRLAALAMRD